MDDVTFGRSEPYADAWNSNGLSITKYNVPGLSLMSMNATFCDVIVLIIIIYNNTAFL